MPKFVYVKDNTIVNIIVADTIEIAKTFAQPNEETLLQEDNMNIGWIFNAETSQWTQPEEDTNA